MNTALYFADSMIGDLIWDVLGGLSGVLVTRLSEPVAPAVGAPSWSLITDPEPARTKGWLDPATSNLGGFHRVVVVDPTGELEGIPTPGEVIVVALPITAEILMDVLRSESSESAGKGPSPTALVLEDSALQRSVVASTLRAEGFVVVEAENGVEGLERLEHMQPDIIITDVEMPEMDGLEFTRHVRKHPRSASVPVIILTTLSGYSEMKAGFDAGASDYLVKPKKGERESFLSRLLEHVTAQLRNEQVVPERLAVCVDDSSMTRKMVANALQNGGFQVIALSDGREAIEYLDSEEFQRPDVLVTDLEMPDVDGLRLTHHVKHTPTLIDIPVVILSGTKRGEHRTLGKGFGADAFLSKPFSEEKLQVTVEQVLGRLHLEKERRELSRIIGRDVIEAVHRDDLAPRKQVMTVFFSDIAGFSSMCSRSTAAQVVELLNEYFDVLVEHASRNQGYVNKFIGDAMVALYSTRPGLASPAVRCVATALGIQREMHVINQNREEPLHTRIGINTGEVVMGLIGSGERKDYTVIGDHVNRAQRFEGKSPVDGVLLSEQTFADARDFIESQEDIAVEEVQGIELKGIQHPVKAYELRLKGER